MIKIHSNAPYHSHSPQSFSNIDSHYQKFPFSSLLLKIPSSHANLLQYEIAPIQNTGKSEDSWKKKIHIDGEFPEAFKNENWQLTSQDYT